MVDYFHRTNLALDDVYTALDTALNAVNKCVMYSNLASSGVVKGDRLDAFLLWTRHYALSGEERFHLLMSMIIITLCESALSVSSNQSVKELANENMVTVKGIINQIKERHHGECL